jgi:hypothetical protein
MKTEEAIKKYQKYFDVVSKDNRGSVYQMNICTLAIAILDGDIEKFNRYLAQARAMNYGHHDAAALGTLVMALIDKTSGEGGLIASILAPVKKDKVTKS